MLIVAVYHSRTETGTIFTSDTFNSFKLTWTAVAEFVAAVAITDPDFFRRLVGTTELTSQQFALAVLPAVVLLVVWELGGGSRAVGRPGKRRPLMVKDRRRASSSRAATSGSLS